jgi:hypothetical protein
MNRAMILFMLREMISISETNNMTIRLRSPNSSYGAEMAADGVRYRQDVGPDYE